MSSCYPYRLLDTSISATDRELFSLSIRLGGLNIPIFAEKAGNDYEISKTLTAPLAAIIATQGEELPDENAGKIIKAHVNKLRCSKRKRNPLRKNSLSILLEL